MALEIAILFIVFGLYRGIISTTDPGCSTTVTETLSEDEVYELESINYPNEYNNYLDCRWEFTVPVTYKVLLKFLDFNLEYGYDYLTVSNEHYDIIAELTGYSIPNPILSKSNQMYLHFTTDSSVTRSGFNGTVKAVLEIDRVFVTESKNLSEGEVYVVKSPNYPENYGNNLDCKWEVNASTGYQLRLNFNDFELEERFDFLKVSNDGIDIITRLTGCNRIPKNLLSGSNQLQLHFSTDFSITYRGFNGTVEAIEAVAESDPLCPVGLGKHLSEGEVYRFNSVHYPQNYDNNLYCTWEVTGSTGYLRLTFFDFNLEYSFDILTVGNNGSDTIARLTGDSIPKPILSNGNRMQLHFSTDSSVTRSGFNGTVEAVSEIVKETLTVGMTTTDGSTSVRQITTVQTRSMSVQSATSDVTTGETTSTLVRSQTSDVTTRKTTLTSVPLTSDVTTGEPTSTSVQSKTSDLTTGKTRSTSVPSTTSDVTTVETTSTSVHTTTSDVTTEKMRLTSVHTTTMSTSVPSITSDVTTRETKSTSVSTTSATVEMRSTSIPPSTMSNVTTGVTASTSVSTTSDVTTAETRSTLVPSSTTYVTTEETVSTSVPSKTSVATGKMTSAFVRSTTADNDGNWQDMQLFDEWIKYQESLLLQKLKESTDNSISMAHPLYDSTAVCVENITNDVTQNINFLTDGPVSASVKVPWNKSNLAVVFIYTVIDDKDILLRDGVSFDDVTKCPDSANITTHMISDVLSISVYEENKTIDAQVQHVLPHTQDSLVNEENYVCGFYDTISSKWSNVGCKVLNVTLEAVTCSCSHLTSFAILMQVSSNELSKTDTIINTWITIIGLILSAVTLTMNLLIYIILKAYRMSTRHKIHINFVVCILLFDLIFLTAINNNGNKSSCKFVAVFLHYLILCMFMWMLAEGFLLILKVVKNNASKYKMKHYMLTCYLAPICIVAMVSAIDNDCYVTEKPCWLRNSCRVAVVMPALLIIAVNSVALSQMVYVIYTRSGSMGTKPQKVQKEYKQLRNAVRGSFVLFPILGITWILGVFVINSSVVFMIYLFTILNSLQGVFVFVIFCFMDREIKEAGTKWINKYIRRNTRIHDLTMEGQQGHSNPLAPTNQEAGSSTATTNM